jgi:hypothetical protein
VLEIIAELISQMASHTPKESEMEIGQTAAPPEHTALASQQSPQPDKVKEQETRRAIAKTEEAAAQETKREREREEEERRAAQKNGGVNIKA